MQDIKIGLSIEKAAELTGIGRTRLFQEIREGRLVVAKVGRRTIVPVARLEQWLADRESRGCDALNRAQAMTASAAAGEQRCKHLERR